MSQRLLLRGGHQRWRAAKMKHGGMGTLQGEGEGGREAGGGEARRGEGEEKGQMGIVAGGEDVRSQAERQLGGAPVKVAPDRVGDSGK